MTIKEKVRRAWEQGSEVVVTEKDAITCQGQIHSFGTANRGKVEVRYPATGQDDMFEHGEFRYDDITDICILDEGAEQTDPDQAEIDALKAENTDLKSKLLAHETWGVPVGTVQERSQNAIAEARQIMREAFGEDPEFKKTYIANLAVMIREAVATGIFSCNVLAEALLDRVFESDMLAESEPDAEAEDEADEWKIAKYPAAIAQALYRAKEENRWIEYHYSGGSAIGTVKWVRNGRVMFDDGGCIGLESINRVVVLKVLCEPDEPEPEHVLASEDLLANEA